MIRTTMEYGRGMRTMALGVCLLIAASRSSAQNVYEIEEAFPHLRFDFPVDLANDGLGNLYVTERAGRIYAFPNDSATTDTTLFLDLRDVVLDEDIESGLLSLSFHPEYAENGYFYVYFVTDGPLRSVLARYTRSASYPDVADPESGVVLLEVPKPTPKHNGGGTAFGPDGYLYLAIGDGSAGGDQYRNAQNLGTLLGKIIRIDVDRSSDDRPYGIPPDNPFAGRPATCRRRTAVRRVSILPFTRTTTTWESPLPAASCIAATA